MKTHRKTIPIVALCLVGGAFSPAAAPAASPLLSGYGGPGQGTQAILGSTLLNGPSSGGGGSTGSGVALAEGPASSAGRGGAGSSSAARGGKGARHGSPSASRGAAASGGGYRSPAALTRASAGGSGVLGLSDSAFLVALLVLAALMFTGLLTRGLAKASWTRRHAGS
jgi:hypothetical protein